MTVVTPRIQVSLEPEVESLLNFLAESQERSKSSMAAILIAKAIELEEDMYFSKLGEKRLEESQEWVSHKDVWE